MGKGDALHSHPPAFPSLDCQGEPSAQAPGTCGSWSRDHCLGIGRQIIYVSRIYESFSVQIAVLVFSSVGKLLWLLKLEQKRESRNSCHFSLVGEGCAFGDMLLFFSSCGVSSLFFFFFLLLKKKSILVVLSTHRERILRETGQNDANFCIKCKVRFGVSLCSGVECPDHVLL